MKYNVAMSLMFSSYDEKKNHWKFLSLSLSLPLSLPLFSLTYSFTRSHGLSIGQSIFHIFVYHAKNTTVLMSSHGFIFEKLS